MVSQGFVRGDRTGYAGCHTPGVPNPVQLEHLQTGGSTFSSFPHVEVSHPVLEPLHTSVLVEQPTFGSRFLHPLSQSTGTGTRTAAFASHTWRPVNVPPDQQHPEPSVDGGERRERGRPGEPGRSRKRPGQQPQAECELELDGEQSDQAAGLLEEGIGFRTGRRRLEHRCGEQDQASGD
jgi:hypothetical protein